MKIKTQYVLFLTLIFLSFLILSLKAKNGTDQEIYVGEEPVPYITDVSMIEPNWYIYWGGSEDDRGLDVAVDTMGNMYITGGSQSFSPGNYDLFLVKYDSFGIEQWNRTWSGAGHEWGRDVIIDSTGFIYIVGVSSSDILLVKYDCNGTLLWDVTWGGPLSDSGFGLTFDSSENIIVVGTSNKDICLVKFNNSGGLIWNQTWVFPGSQYAHDVTIDSSGNIFTSANHYSGGSSSMLLVKFNDFGIEQWNRTLKINNQNTNLYAHTIDTDDNVYLTGIVGATDNWDLALAKYNQSGELCWAETWSEGYSNYGHSIVTDSFNNVYITGNTNGPIQYSKFNVLLVKFDESGQYIWNATWNSVGGSAQGNGITLDSSGIIYITGRDETRRYDAFLIKYDIDPKIEIDKSINKEIYGSTSPFYNLSLLSYIGEIDGIWYNLNDGANITIISESGALNQSAWDTCGNGTVSIKFYANDSAGNLSFDETVVRKDINLPEISIHNPITDQPFGAKAPNFNLSIYDSDLHTSWYTLNDIGFVEFTDKEGEINQSLWDSFLNDTIKVTFYSNNSIGNIASNEVVVNKLLEIDVSEPIPNQIFNEIAPSYNFSLTDWNLYNISYTLNSGLNHTISDINGFINQTAWNICPDGQVEITFYASYLKIFTLEKTIIVSKDTTNPIITINSPYSFQEFGNSTLNLFYDLTVDELYIDTIWYSLNHGANNTISETFGRINQSLWDFCSNGTVTISFYANDTLGNLALSEVLVIKDYYVLPPRNAYAIVIGVEDYPGTNSDLDYCRDDAEAMAISLVATYNFKPENIILLLDSAATSNAIGDAFSQIYQKITSEDVFFFYFSGHGGYDVSIGEFIAPYDSINPFNPSKIYWDYVLDYRLSSLDCAQKYIIIDACNSGGVIDEWRTRSYYMSSCRDNELSYETSSLAHGIFTYFFLRSDSLATDSNGDGVISMEEQYSYVYSNSYSYSGYQSCPQENDRISGQAVLNPSLGSFSIDISTTQLNYSFYVYGHGFLRSIEILVGSVSNNLILKTRNLKTEAPSISGFGYYSGSIDLGSNNTITGYEVLIEIEGYNNLTFYHAYGDTDGDGLYDTLELREGIDPRTNDTDGDGLNDYFEFNGITNPLNNDTDYDEILDGYEVLFGLNPLINDSYDDLDNDGLTNIFEYQFGSSVNNADTDSDGIPDGWEFNNGLDLFIDDAGLDLDFDGLSNLIEYQIGSNFNNSDTDSDTMLDGWEYNNDLNLILNDTASDYDNDGLTNLFEYQFGSFANNADTDGDGIPDGWEYNNALNLFINDSGLDLDFDGLSNLIEYQIGSNFNDSDTDSDTMLDGWEYNNGLDLFINDTGQDPDNDGLTNIEEFQLGTDPQSSDTDGDNWSDSDEVEKETDPTDPNDFPKTNSSSISGYPFILLIPITLVLSFIIFKRIKQKIIN